MKKIFLTLSLLLFAFPILSLVHFHRGGGDKLLTSQSSSPLVDRFTSNDLWGASLKTTGSNAQLAEEAKAESNKGKFLDLFFRNQNQDKAVEIFKLFVDNTNDFSDSDNVLLWVAYVSDDITKKTSPFSANWKLNAIATRRFVDSSKPKPTQFGSWIQFLEQTNDQTLTETNADPNNFFWEQFFEAYLYFVGLVNKSKITPYSDESFLLFLANLEVRLITYYASRILSLQKASFLQYLPGVDLKYLGTKQIDFTPILNLNPNTFTLKDLTIYITQKVANYHFYDPLDLVEGAASFELKAPYKANIQLLKGLVEKPDFWTTLNAVLKNNLGIQFLFLNGARYDLENLIASFSHYDPGQTVRNFAYSATNQFREELTKLIFANKRGIQYGIDTPDKLQKLFDDTKDRLLSSLQTALRRLQEVDATTSQLPINGNKHDLSSLLQVTSKLLNPNLETEETGIVTQIKTLFSKQIYGFEIAKAANQLAKYKEILPFLTKLATDQKRTSLQIKDQNYSFASLIADAKKQFADFAKDSLDELQKLIEGKIIVSQLKTTYQESLSSPSTENKSPTQESTNQNLVIGLGTAGGVVALAGAGGFAYWFVKIRKP